MILHLIYEIKVDYRKYFVTKHYTFCENFHFDWGCQVPRTNKEKGWSVVLSLNNGD